MLGVVEDLGVPLGVVSLRAAVRVAVVGAVHLSDAVEGVRGGVRMHEVYQDLDAEPVGHIHHLLQLLGGARSAGGREEGGHVVAEATVVGVLRNGHELHGIVAHALDAGQHIAREVQVRGDLGIEGAHADVALVDLQGLRLRGSRVLERVHLRCGRLPKHTVEEVGSVVLPGELRPGWHPVVPGPVAGLQADLDLALVRHGALGQEDGPSAEALARQRCAVLPAIELADEEDLLRVRHPLPVGVAALGPVEAKNLVAEREVEEATLVFLEFL
mmetsp:Transcript_38740/g.111253  ORF Transcript_38740/g.111253 Transcript_38740/m.111253 type:complete len:272 (-) Transcript_38740:147-962(-)